MKLDFSDLYYIHNFRFADGSTKNKYLIVLSDADESQTLLLNLPTSIGRVPAHLESGQFGCINCDKSMFNCFRFLANIEVTDNPANFFPRDTFIYGEWIQSLDSNALKMNYPIDGIDYEYMGKIKPQILKDILECFVNSIKVKRVFKKEFLEIIQKI